MRILKDFAGVVIESRANLFAIYPNHKQFPADHLALYGVRAWRASGSPSPDSGGIEHSFFASNQLPPDLDAQTAARIRAVTGARAN